MVKVDNDVTDGLHYQPDGYFLQTTHLNWLQVNIFPQLVLLSSHELS